MCRNDDAFPKIQLIHYLVNGQLRHSVYNMDKRIKGVGFFGHRLAGVQGGNRYITCRSFDNVFID